MKKLPIEDIVLKDLSARLPYGVKVLTPNDKDVYTLLALHPNKNIAVIGFEMDGMYVTSKVKIEDCKPLLRPMSNMTEEEKEELLNIIEEVRDNHISSWFNGRIVTDKEIGETFKNPTALYLIKDEPWTPEDARKANQMEWNHKALLWRNHFTNKNGEEHYPNINVDIKNKWLVSGSGLYEYTIFDLIHILKIFDWENDELICIGG